MESHAHISTKSLGTDFETLSLLYESFIKSNDLRRISEKSDNLKFWQWNANNQKSGIDGETWSIEGIKYGKYNLVSSWCPTDKSFISLVNSLADIGKYKIKYLNF